MSGMRGFRGHFCGAVLAAAMLLQCHPSKSSQTQDASLREVEVTEEDMEIYEASHACRGIEVKPGSGGGAVVVTNLSPYYLVDLAGVVTLREPDGTTSGVSGMYRLEVEAPSGESERAVFEEFRDSEITDVTLTSCLLVKPGEDVGTRVERNRAIRMRQGMKKVEASKENWRAFREETKKIMARIRGDAGAEP